MEFKIEQHDSKFFAFTEIGKLRLYLWRDGSLRPYAATRYKRDEGHAAYFRASEGCQANVDKFLNKTK